jgi:ubiquinol-cytochrome c reductase cytochrome c subunit
VKKLSARRRHPLAAVVVLLLALAAPGGLYAAFAPAGKAQADETAQSLAIEEGKKLRRGLRKLPRNRRSGFL